MLCNTTRAGQECAFMGKSGCGFNGGTCHPAVEPCQGCERSVTVGDMVYCKSYPDPAASGATAPATSPLTSRARSRKPQEPQPPQGLQRAHAR